MPPGMGYDYMGMSFQEQEAEKGISAGMVFGLSMLFVFLILAALYESWTLPLSVLLGVPIAVFGGFMALYLRNFENDVYTQIGMIMLIGLSAKNAILIVEFAKTEFEKGGKTVAEAALDGARIRLAPHPDDGLRFHLRMYSFIRSRRSGRRLPPDPGHGGNWRNAGGHHDRGLSHPGDLRRDRIAFTADAEESSVAAGRTCFAGREGLMARILFSLALVLLLGLSACVQGPNYQRPQLDIPPAYRGPDNTATPGAPESLGNAAWWTVFQDPALAALVKTALAQNLDLRIAANHVLQAQDAVVIARSAQFPTLAGGLEVSGERVPSGGASYAAYNIPEIGVAGSWSPDFWGKYRRLTEAARANLVASEWARRAVVSDLVSGVAAAYFDLRTLDRQLAISQRTLASRQDSLGLIQTLVNGGGAPLSDQRQAEQLVETAAAAIPNLEREIQQQENAINVLLGTEPRSRYRPGGGDLRAAGARSAARRHSFGPARTAARYRGSRAEPGCRQRPHRRRTGGVFPRYRADRDRWNRQRCADHAIPGRVPILDVHRFRHGTDLYQGTPERESEACRSPAR